MWDSMYAYIGSLFPNMKEWKYTEGVYPFESGNKPWRLSFVPSLDGETWRLHSGKKAKIVFEKVLNNI